MARIEIEDVQGIVLHTYDELPHLTFVLLSARGCDTTTAQRWLKTVLPEVRSAAETPTRTAVSVAFTHPGLEAFGVPAQTLDGLSRQFRDDVRDDEHRNRTLGDEGDSCPDRWVWGGPEQSRRPTVHVALMLYAKDEPTLEELREQHEKCFKQAGLQLVSAITTVPLPGQKEHFGFRDGISQPRIANDNLEHERNQIDALMNGTPDNTVRAGEFLYGYEDELGEIPASPLLPRGSDPRGRLRPDATGLPDFGRNGTYLVARQLSQDVPGFWRFVFGQGKSFGQDPVRLAAKMVGRWPNGAPLVLAPNGPLPELEKAADFTYAGEGDSDGYRCPLGSHIRRANPRDALVEDEDASRKIVKRHRLIRRGRPYGKPVDPSMDPCKMLEPPPDDVERGLLFLAFNVHFDRQFEFIQQNWLNNPKFGDLYTDADPIAGKIRPDSTFTQQRVPMRLRVSGLKSFVQVRGSGYFFMPGLPALKWLTDDVQPFRAEVPHMPFDPSVGIPPVDQPPRDVPGDVGR